MYEGFSDPEHVKRERRKAQELRKSSWWKQQVGPGLCHHCGAKFPKEVLTLDHLIPLSRGGKSAKKNCVPACKPCNSEKGHLFSVEKTFLQMESERQTGHPPGSDSIHVDQFTSISSTSNIKVE